MDAAPGASAVRSIGAGAGSTTRSHRRRREAVPSSGGGDAMGRPVACFHRAGFRRVVGAEAVVFMPCTIAQHRSDRQYHRWGTDSDTVYNSRGGWFGLRFGACQGPWQTYGGRMPKRSRISDLNEIAARIVERTTGTKPFASRRKNPAAVALGRLGGLKGGRARAKKLSAEQRSQIASRAATIRWENSASG